MENLQFPIPNSVLEPYIKQAVSTAIVGALGDGTKLIEMAVSNALQQKVNSMGKVSNSSYDNNFIFAEVVAKNKIQEIAREVIHEMAEGMRPKIQDCITRQLQKKHKQIADVLVDGLIESLTSRWSVSLKLSSD